jgi:hypothetical protein
MKWSRRRIAVLAAIATTLVFAAVAAAGSGLGNGDFERGNFDNWTVTSVGGAEWEVYSGNQTPFIGIPFWRPPQGNWGAVTEEEGAGQTALTRSLSLGTTKTQQISFYVYYQDFCGTFYPWEQEYRIDILADGTDPLTTDPGDILKTLFVTKPGDKSTMSPKYRTYVLSGLHGRVTLRFLVTAACNELNGATDKVVLQSAS